MSNSIQLTGTAMAVLIGTALIIAPWILTIGFGSKLLLFCLGIILVWGGLVASSS